MAAVEQMNPKEGKAKADESKSDKFRRLATRRVTRVVENLRSLGKLGNRSIYEYDEEQIRTIEQLIEKEFENAMANFRSPNANEEIRVEI